MIRKLAVIAPLLLVNSVSVIGQVEYWHSHLPWPFLAALGFALSCESLAVYVAYHASLAELSQDSAFRLRFASYVLGAVIGLLNGSHFLSHGRITAASVGMFLLSASSPWLWAMHARRQSRDILKQSGLIDDRAVRLGMRWVFFPRSAMSVFRMAVWSGDNNISDVLDKWETREAAKQIIREAEAQAERDALTLETAPNQATAIRIAITELGETASTGEIVEYLGSARPRAWSVTPARVRQVRAQVRAASAPLPSNVRALPGAGQSESG